jgi:hypothetical protein
MFHSAEVVRGLLLDIGEPESVTVSPSSGRHLIRAGFAIASARRNDIHSEDLMKPDLVSEILLLGSGAVVFVALVLLVVNALMRS